MIQTGVPATVVLCSSIPWDELRPPRGDAPEPVQLYLAAPTKEGKSELWTLTDFLAEMIKVLSPASEHPLFARFLDLLLATLLPLSPYPLQDLEHHAEPLWQIYTSRLPSHLEANPSQAAVCRSRESSGTIADHSEAPDRSEASNGDSPRCGHRRPTYWSSWSRRVCPVYAFPFGSTPIT